MFRSADGAGVSKIFLSGYTPRPVDRFGREQKDIAKTALGAEKSVSWEYYSSPAAVMEKMKKEGWQIVGIEQDARSVDYRSASLAEKVLFLPGNEVRGLSPQLRAQCDLLLEIPLHGRKESLNVSVATGIVLFHVSHYFSP